MVRGAPNPLHFGFSERLRRARKAADLTHASLANRSGSVSRTTTAALEAGENVPRVDTVEHLANALGMSPGLLAFGIGGSCNLDEGLRCGGLPVRLRAVREARGLSMRQLGQLASASVVLVRSTEIGASVPNLARLEALAKALGVSPSWLAYAEGAMEWPSRRRMRSPDRVSTGESSE